MKKILTSLLVISLLASGAFADPKKATTKALPKENPLSINKNNVPTAEAHYMKSRAYLIEAVREFDAAEKLTRSPSALMNSKAFRNNIIDRAEELGKIIEPQNNR